MIYHACRTLLIVSITATLVSCGGSGSDSSTNTVNSSEDASGSNPDDNSSTNVIVSWKEGVFEASSAYLSRTV